MKECSIDGCGKRYKALGWCRSHYERFRLHGDPLSGRIAPGAAEKYFRKVVLTYEGEGCLTWPFCRNEKGYGILKDGIVSRLVCEEAHGPPPTSLHEAAHSCGKGHEACCTKRHLSWKTHAENMADRVVHGTTLRGERSPSAKITAAEAYEILSLKGSASQQAIGDQFGISQTAVSLIHNRRSWKTLLMSGTPLEELDMLEIDPDAEEDE